MQTHVTSNRQAYAEWWGSSTIILAVLGMLAVHAPARIKLIGLFSIAIGLLAGFASRYLAMMWGLSPTKSLMVSVGIMLLALQIGVGVGTWQRHLRVLDADKEANPVLAQMALQREQVLAARTEDGSDERKLQQEMLQSIESNERMLLDEIDRERRFGHYLEQRLSTIGALTPPWPAVIWSAEILLGTAAGLWIFRRTFQSSNADDNVTLKHDEKGIAQ
ncbi:MAG: hypothetical protein ACKVT0_14735 [Planctomycetaceae bacterium]